MKVDEVASCNKQNEISINIDEQHLSHTTNINFAI